jgi:hypothetical protein
MSTDPTLPDNIPTAPRRPSIQERLLDLAQDVSSYLRHHSSSAVRASAALLLAASLAGCSPDASEEADGIAPLTEEVRGGLPNASGRYPIQPQSLARDAQGVYYFNWSQPGLPPQTSSSWTGANVSLLQLGQGERDELEIPASGDPTLHLRPDTPIPIVDSATEAVAIRTAASGPSPTGTPGGSGSGSSYYGRSYTPWYPFYASTYSGPAYRDPPSTPLSSRGAVEGSRTSTSPPSPESRVAGLAHAVSGQSGGTGGGTAATFKSGAEAVSKGSGAATSKSSGFSIGGKSGGSFGSSSGSSGG